MERRAIVVRGIVQGVGFRPFVFGLATRRQLGGFVRNQTGSVEIEVEGEADSLERFLADLVFHAPPLAQIESLWSENRSPQGERQFRIESSANGQTGATVFFSPDTATCADCLRELFDPQDRRFGYPFLNCTNCGPRLTIITGAPYDRPRTTMASFQMCAACRAEYENPGDRRFHAQPIACSVCGPRMQLCGPNGELIQTADPLAPFVDSLRAGGIGALKGLGGYHLSCDARNSSAVAELRRRKHRDEKAFAVMAADIVAAEALCNVSAAERALLLSPQRPIVLLRKREKGATIAAEVAPGNPWLGVMLPYAPLHHLLMKAADGMLLVMTSGNRSDEPIAYRDDEALVKLAGIADLFLVHNRPIYVRCDDSVICVVDGKELPVRRSRGYAPRPIEMPVECPEFILAVGGQLKVTFALGRGRQAFLSHHMGDLDFFDAYQAFLKDVALYEELFAIRPDCIVHDLHPDYVTTRFAHEMAQKLGSALLSVQHHHAHMASCMAEHGLVEKVIGVTFDGTGYGLDGAVWGGEFLIGDYCNFYRAAHLRYVGMPGGEQAIREPWRMALAHLVDAGVPQSPVKARLLQNEWQTIERMLERRLNTPLTSSAGRLFDAVASLAGVRDRVSYEGHAAIELEWLATDAEPQPGYPFAVESGASVPDRPLIIDTRPLIHAVAEDATRQVSARLIARRFHTTMVDMIAQTCGRLRSATGLNAVVLSGGVFLNRLLTAETCTQLHRDGFRVYRHERVPPNDGGLCLGQLAIAGHQRSQRPEITSQNRTC
ncbi:MAG TPA: carbamoyltransferase HypF [Gemmataceae bacterium]|nr:carbamoyltransferase HypF [Gemmataceae bacterium]